MVIWSRRSRMILQMRRCSRNHAKNIMVSANLVPRSPMAKGKGISSCMYILEVFIFFYDNDNDYNTLQSDDFFGFQSTFICLSANRLNYYLSSSLSPSFSRGLAIHISFSSSSTRVVVPQVIMSIKATRNFLNRTA